MVGSIRKCRYEDGLALSRVQCREQRSNRSGSSVEWERETHCCVMVPCPLPALASLNIDQHRGLILMGG